MLNRAVSGKTDQMLKDGHLAVTRASYLLHRGAVIAYPTEAVWGLGCDPHNESALTKLLELKGRNADKGLILVAASVEQFAAYLDGLSGKSIAMLKASWPGPTSWLVPDNGHASKLVTGSHDSVALRVSAHPRVAELCRAFGGPIVSTSANYSGRPPARRQWQLRRQFVAGLDFIVGGDLGQSNTPSEIRDLMSGKTIRSA